MRANNPLLLGFLEDIHRTAEFRGPVVFLQAMHQENINIVRLEFLAETIEVGAHARFVPRPRFGQHRHLVAWDALEGRLDVGMRPVGVCRIDEPDALVVSRPEQVGKPLDAQLRLVRGVIEPARTCAHGQPRGLDSGLAQRNEIRRLEGPRSLRGPAGPGL